MLFFKPKWQNKNECEALKAVQEVVSNNDQALLCRIAKKAYEPSVRSAATEKITDNGVLKRIALEDSNAAVRRTALNHITNKDYLPFDGTIGCRHFDMEHSWERISYGCMEKCNICGKEREKHTWIKGECMVCGLKLESIKGLRTVQLSSLVNPHERGVICNALTYALRNWGKPSEETQIEKLIFRIANDEQLNKNDILLLGRVYRAMVEVFSDNAELQIDGVFLLINNIVHNMN